MTKILVYELNEVPWKVVDYYLSLRHNSNLRKYLDSASQITTHTRDTGELHPWSTWPTMHRGVTNDVHKINYINQDLTVASNYPPVWRILIDEGVSTGIFGALQSFPPLVSEYSLFHVPDTFAPDKLTHPEKYENFQRLNLRLTGENSAKTGQIGQREILAGAALLVSGLTPSTAFKVATHLCKERLNPKHKSRRAIMQAPVSFDIYINALSRYKPRYSSFFTNHVAGIMHRYWKHSFPEDFSGKEFSPDYFHSQSLLAAMDIVDKHLGKLMQFSRANGYELLVASSMGQEAIDRGEYVPELKLADADLLAKSIGFEKRFKMNLAMQPDIALEFENRSDLGDFLRRTEFVTGPTGEQILYKRYPAHGNTLNLAVRPNKDAVVRDSLNVQGFQTDLGSLGFEVVERDQGTAYHQPYGILVWHGESKPTTSDRQVMDSRQFAPTILRALGVNIPSYMLDPVK